MTTPTIHQAMGAILSEIGPIAKERHNEQQGFVFRGIDEVMNAFHPVLARHGVIVLPEVIDRSVEVRTTRSGSAQYAVALTVRYTFSGPAGDTVSCVVAGEASDLGDKATNKAMAAAMKYALMQTFCVALEADDADATTPEETVGARAAEEIIGRPQADHIMKVLDGIESAEQRAQAKQAFVKEFGAAPRMVPAASTAQAIQFAEDLAR
jgi:hypothetical protein